MDILVRAIIAIVVVFFTQLILAEVKLDESARKVIFLVVLFLAVLFLLFGSVNLPLFFK